ALVSGEAAERALKNSPSTVLARVTGARKGAIIDGIEDDDTCDRLIALVDRSDEVATMLGSVRGVLTGAHLDVPAERKWARGSADQSNSVVFLSDRYVLKMFRRIEPGPNPEFEVGRFLADHGFTRMPALAGALDYARPGMEPGTLAVVQAAVKHQGSGWEYTIDELRRYYERVAARIRRTETATEIAPSR